MESLTEIVELDVRVASDGTAVVPARVIERLGVRPGSKLRVKLIPRALSHDLVRLGVTGEEIEQIASVQLEPRSIALGFLGSEGALSAEKRFRQRVRNISR